MTAPRSDAGLRPLVIGAGIVLTWIAWPLVFLATSGGMDCDVGGTLADCDRLHPLRIALLVYSVIVTVAARFSLRVRWVSAIVAIVAAADFGAIAYLHFVGPGSPNDLAAIALAPGAALLGIGGLRGVAWIPRRPLIVSWVAYVVIVGGTVGYLWLDKDRGVDPNPQLAANLVGIENARTETTIVQLTTVEFRLPPRSWTGIGGSRVDVFDADCTYLGTYVPTLTQRISMVIEADGRLTARAPDLDLVDGDLTAIRSTSKTCQVP